MSGVLHVDAAPARAPGAITQQGCQPGIHRWLSLTDWQRDRRRLTNAVVPGG